MADIISSLNELIPSNISNLEGLPPELISKIGTLMTILKAAGIIFIIYILYLIINGILSWRRNRNISKMYDKVNEIDEKINEILQKFEKRRDRKEKKDKKRK